MALAKSDPTDRLNVLREYVQICVLRSLHESEAFRAVAFVGGTALRFLWGLPRFSEDLDFSLEDQGHYDPVRWLGKLKRDLTAQGFEAEVQWNDSRVVHVAWLRLCGLLREVGLAAISRQKLSIKIEVDSRPPAGANSVVTLLERHRLLLALRHYDLPSLMAGKLHALLVRRYSKGRDWFDLAFYRARRPPVEPNLVLLQHALDQTEGAGKYEARRWREMLEARLEQIQSAELKRDVRAFLERAEDAEWLEPTFLRSLLRAE